MSRQANTAGDYPVSWPQHYYPSPPPMPYPPAGFGDFLKPAHNPSVPEWLYKHQKRVLADLVQTLFAELPEILLARDSKLHAAYQAALRELASDPNDVLSGSVEQAIAYQSNQYQAKSNITGEISNEAHAGKN